MCGRSSGAMPGPSSPTQIVTQSPLSCTCDLDLPAVPERLERVLAQGPQGDAQLRGIGVEMDWAGIADTADDRLVPRGRGEVPR